MQSVVLEDAMTHIKKCKAKGMHSDQYYIGSYFQMPKVNSSPMSMMSDETYERFQKENTGHYIVFYQQGDWDMDNEIKVVEIDLQTLRVLEEEWTIG